MRNPYWIALLLTAACGGDDDGPTDTGAPPPTDTSRPPTDIGDVEMCRTALPVDMLWVIDNSNSMAEEQLNLAAAFPALIETLTNPPDDDGDGEPDFPPVVDLRTGIITTDMGVADNSGVIGCPSPIGDDGIMVSDSRAMGACDGFSLNGPKWLSFNGSDIPTFNDGFSCLAQLGTNGCGLEQQLEASLKALTTHHGAGGPHEGFLRTDSLVAIVYVTDEDDCSAADTSIFDPTPVAEMTDGPLGTRCAFHPEKLHPISRYVDAFRLLSLDRRGDVIVAAITGVPRALTEDPADVDFDAVLGDERMQYRGERDQSTATCSGLPTRRGRKRTSRASHH